MSTYKDGKLVGGGGGGGGPTTPGSTVEKGVVVFGSTDGSSLADTGVRDYGKQSSDPTSPTPANGDKYWNTTYNQKMVYDGGLGNT